MQPNLPLPPLSTLPRIGFIGAGRLATAVAWGLARRGACVVAVASRRRASSQALATNIPGCAVMDSASALAACCDLVFITVPDDSIAEVAASALWRAGSAVVHCSGATEIDTLAAAHARGASIGGFHPLQSFADPLAAIESLPGCSIAIEAEPSLSRTLHGLAALLGCRVISLPPGARPLYHAAGGYASQFVNVLMHEAARIWASFGIAEDEAVRALLPLLRGTVAAIERSGPVKALPGPISRGDIGTVAKHVAALASPAFVARGSLDLYRELARRTIDMAVEKGSIDEAKARALDAVLGAGHSGRRTA